MEEYFFDKEVIQGKPIYTTNSKAKSLTTNERLEVLLGCINYTLDVRNKEEFMELTEEYNKLKLDLSRENRIVGWI